MGVVYHPPKPSYDVVSFLEYLEAEVDEIMRTFPTSEIVMVGDFNQLSDTDLIQRTGLMQIVDQPTRGANRLDRILESSPIHAGVKVVTSAVKSDHLAIIAYTGCRPTDINKKRTVLQHRPRTPDQHAAFLAYLSDKNWDDVLNTTDTQSAFDIFYASVLSMLDTFYPLRAVTVTNRDPYFVTPKVKSLLRKRNRLMRRGRIEKAESITKRISQSIVDQAKSHFLQYQ